MPNSHAAPIAPGHSHRPTSDTHRRIAAAHRPGRLLAPHKKTELAKAFGRWWRDTGGTDDPRFVFWHSIEPGMGVLRPGRGDHRDRASRVRRRLRGPAAR